MQTRSILTKALWKGQNQYLLAMQRRNFSHGVIDMRSDTVTKPCQKMRDAIATCEVGDDIYKDDPTI